jgi:hypothetical protein
MPFKIYKKQYGGKASPVKYSHFNIVLYNEVIKVENKLESIDSFVKPNVLKTVHPMYTVKGD